MPNYCDVDGNCKCPTLANEQKCKFYTRAEVFSIAGSCIWRSFVSGCMSALALEDARKADENRKTNSLENFQVGT